MRANWLAALVLAAAVVFAPGLALADSKESGLSTVSPGNTDLVTGLHGGANNNFTVLSIAQLLLPNANTWTAAQTYTNSDFLLLGSSTGATTFTSANASATNYTLTIPAATDTMALLAATQTLSNKTLASPTVSGVETVPVGSCSAPSIIFSGDTGSGFARLASNSVSICAQSGEVARFAGASSAANHIEFDNEATGTPPIIKAVGDTNAGIYLNGAGTGTVYIGNGGGEDLYVTGPASSAHWIAITGSASGSPTVTAAGATNLGLWLGSNGNQPVQLATGSGLEVEVLDTANVANMLTLTGAASGSAPAINTTGGNLSIGSNGGEVVFISGLTLSDLDTGTQVSCLGLTSANKVVANNAACGSGGGGSPGGTSGQIQYNSSGSFGGFTMSGDATLVASTGVLTIAANAVTYAKFQQSTAGSVLLCVSGGSAANYAQCTLANGLTFNGTTLAPTAPDNTTASGNYTMSATDMAGQRNFSGTSQTVTIPAISSTVFATGMTSVISNQGSGNLSITTTPTLNGIASASQIDIDGWISCVSNNTSLDCIGFPGFGTITTNALGKFNDSTGAMTASSLVDNGTVVLSSEPLGVTTAEGMFYAVPNDASTGTTVNKLAKLTSAGKAIIGSTTDTAGILGIVISTTATTGNAEIVYAGQAVCAFDGTATDGDFVIPSTSAAGKCHDSGTASPSAPPTGAQVIGLVQTGGSGAANYTVAVALGYTNAGGSGCSVSGSGLVFAASSSCSVDTDVTLSSHTITFGSSAITDFSAMSVTAGFKLPAASSAAPTSDDFFAFDTAAHNPVFGSNGSTGKVAAYNLAQTWSAAQSFNSGDFLLKGSSSNSITLNAAAAAGGGTIALPSIAGSDTLAALGTAETWTGAQTFTSGDFILKGSSSSTLTLNAAAAAGGGTVAFPAVAATDTVALLGTAGTWTAAQTFGEVIGATTTQSGTGGSAYTLAATDCGTMVQFSGAAPTVTIPDTLPAGCSISMEQTHSGTAAVTLAAGSGATLHKAFTNGTTRTQYSVIGITIESNSGGTSAVAVMWGDAS